MIFQLCDLVLFLYERGSGQSCWLWFCWEMRWEKMCKIQEFGEKPSTRLCCRQQESRTRRYRHPCWTGSQEQRLREQSKWRRRLPGQNLGMWCPWAKHPVPIAPSGAVKARVRCKIISWSFPVMAWVTPCFSSFLTSDMNSNVKYSWPTVVPLSRFSSDGFLKIHFEHTPW